MQRKTHSVRFMVRFDATWTATVKKIIIIKQSFKIVVLIRHFWITMYFLSIIFFNLSSSSLSLSLSLTGSDLVWQGEFRENLEPVRCLLTTYNYSLFILMQVSKLKNRHTQANTQRRAHRKVKSDIITVKHRLIGWILKCASRENQMTCLIFILLSICGCMNEYKSLVIS